MFVGVCVLECVAGCCRVLQSVVRVFQCVAVYCSALQCIAVCCSVLQCVAVCCSVLPSDLNRKGKGDDGLGRAVNHIYGVATISRIDKILGLFCEYCLFYRALLQKRPIILSILLTKATP